MGFFDKLFGKRKGSSLPTKAASPTVISQADAGPPPKAASPTVINQADADPPLKIDPASITHAFIALTHADISHSDKVSSKIADLNRHCQPQLWNVQFRAKFVTFAVNAGPSGYPDATGVGSALESVGLKPPYSVVVNLMTISLDGGRTGTNILSGVCIP